MVGDSVENNERARIDDQMAFFLAVDQLKGLQRTCAVADGSRRENGAENSWHVALMALVLSEYCTERIDVGRLVRILIVHDLVEVYAGARLSATRKPKWNRKNARRMRPAGCLGCSQMISAMSLKVCGENLRTVRRPKDGLPERLMLLRQLGYIGVNTQVRHEVR